jgi:hypothetical protein
MASLKPLFRKLIEQLPGAQIVSSQQSEYYSATFAGIVVHINMFLLGKNARQSVAHFKDALPDVEFTLPRTIVADILVTEIAQHGDGCNLKIEALLLDD